MNQTDCILGCKKPATCKQVCEDCACPNQELSDVGHCCSCDDRCCHCEGPGLAERHPRRSA